MNTDEAVRSILDSDISSEAETDPLKEQLNKAEETNKILTEQLQHLISAQIQRETKQALENIKLKYPDFNEADISRSMQEYAASIPGVNPETAENLVRQAFDNPEGWRIFYMANKMKDTRRPDEHIRTSFAPAPAPDIRSELKNPESAGEALLRLGR